MINLIFRAYLPIFLIQIYLIITLLVFQFGPLIYHIESPYVFWFYIFLYHLSLFIGYYSATNIYSFSNANISKFKHNFLPPFLFFKFILICSFIASVISMKNFSLLQILDPTYLVKSVLVGIENPGEQYTLKMQNVSASSGNKFLNSILFLFAFAKVLVIPCLIAYWKSINIYYKFFGLFCSSLPVISSISNGTNKAIFDFAIFFVSSLFAIYVYNKMHFGRSKFNDFKFFNVLMIFSFFGAFLFFGLTIGQRGGSVLYLLTTSPIGHIKLNNYNAYFSQYGELWYVYTWFSNYLVQGYYGFSLSLEQPFDSTFGFGNSVFLSRQFQFLTGFDLTPLTYQAKITHLWDESAQWHSFYSHIANDVHFIGVVFVMFFLGYFISKVWFRFIVKSDFWSFLLIPLLALLVIFIPANNQIFGLLDTFSAFLFVFLSWLRFRYRNNTYVQK